MSRHTLSVLVENRPAVLMRVAALFARRAFNIESLAVGPTENAGTSRITIVVDVEPLPLEQMVKQLNKLVNVLKVAELEAGSSVQRELLLVKVRADNTTRPQVMAVTHLFRTHVVDVAPDALVVEAIGSPEKNAALLRALEAFGVRETVQSGVVGLSRGPKALADRSRG